MGEVAQLGESGELEAYDVLVRWSKKPMTGCRGKTLRSKIAKNKDCYACLRAPLERALEKFPEKSDE